MHKEQRDKVSETLAAMLTQVGSAMTWRNNLHIRPFQNFYFEEVRALWYVEIANQTNVAKVSYFQPRKRVRKMLAKKLR